MATRRAPAAPAGETLEIGAPSGVVTNSAGQVAPYMGDDEGEAAEDDIADRLRGIFGTEATDNCKVILSRVDPRTKARAWLTEYTIEEFMEGGIALVNSQFGPGRYEWRAYGNRALLTRGGFIIGEPPAKQVATSAPSELAQVLGAMTQTLGAILERVSTPAPAPAPVDPMAPLRQMKEMAEIMRALNPPAPAQAPAASGVQALTDALALVRSVREVAKEIEPPEHDDSPMGLLGSIVEMVKGAQQSPQQVQPVGALVPPSMLQVEETPEMTQDQSIAQLLKFAQENAPIADAASFVANSLPPELHAFLRMPTWFDFLSQFAPALAPHHAYLSQVREAALTLLE